MAGLGVANWAKPRKQAKAKVEAIRKQKLPTSGAEIERWLPAVADGENGALVISEGFTKLLNFQDGRSNTVIVTNLLGMKEWSAETKGVVREYLDMNQPALAKIREGLRFSAFRYPVQYSDGYAALLPHLGKCKSAASMIGIEAALAVVEGRTNEWPTLMREEIRLIETLNGDVSLIGQLVRNASLTIAHDIARWALEHGAPSTEHCRELQEAFRRAGETNLYPQTLITERAMTLPVFKASISDLDRMGDQQGVTEKELNQNGFTIYQITGRADRDKVFYLDFMERAIETAKLGPPMMLSLVDDFEVTINTAKENRYIIPGMFLPALGKTTVRFVTVQAAMRMTATAFALERFNRTRGRMPEKLNELVPEFMESVPIDPFDGGEMRYAAAGANGYRIYSVGEDGLDDDGMEAPRRKKSTDTNRYDVVFKVER